MGNTETVTVNKKVDGYEIIVQHNQSGSAYSFELSNDSYRQLCNQLIQPKTTTPQWIKATEPPKENGYFYCRRTDTGGRFLLHYRVDYGFYYILNPDSVYNSLTLEWLDESSTSVEEVNKKMKDAIETLLTGIEYFAFERSAAYVITTPDIIMLKDAVAYLPSSSEEVDLFLTENGCNPKQIEETANRISSDALPVTGESEAIGERTFTLKEVLELWECGYDNGWIDGTEADTHMGDHNDDTFNMLKKRQYFKDKFGIDI